MDNTQQVDAPGEPSEDDFVSRVLAVVETIPPGRVMSYGDVAEFAGVSSARMVGRILALDALADQQVPWHRVLRSDGRIAFPEGSEAYATQVRLLKRERVAVVNGRVAKTAFAWREDDLDASLWRPDFR